jgi:hypothetical protein
MTVLPGIPRAPFYEFCAAAFDLQLQPVVCAGARESFATSNLCERDWADVTWMCQRDLPHAAARRILREIDWNRGKSNPVILGID